MFDAIVFPGQGSQRLGMALDFAERYPAAKKIFERADKALGFCVTEICATDEARLNLTEYTQPCILTAEIAMLEALRERLGATVQVFAGHSLGEYSALVAAGALQFETALKLVHLRGQLMQRAVPQGVGAMAAVIMKEMPHHEIRQIAIESEVDLANDNSCEQVVLSGEKNAVEAAAAKLTAKFASVRVVMLNVSAPFHSRHMREIEQPFFDALTASQGDFDASQATRVLSNFSGQFHRESLSDLLNSLTRQITHTVRWRDNITAIVGRTNRVLELGPHKPLRGFFASAGVPIQSVMDVRSWDRLALH